MKNTTKTAAVLMAAALMLTGCASGQEDSSEVGSAPETSSVQEAQDSTADSQETSEAEAAESKAPDLPPVELTEEEQAHIDKAKETITAFYEASNEGKFSRMAELCSQQLNDNYGYDKLDDLDEPNTTQMQVEFLEDCAVLTDPNGDILAVQLVKVTNAFAASPTTCYMAVRLRDGEYRIDDIATYTEGETRASDYLNHKLTEFTRQYLLMMMVSAYSVQTNAETPYEDGVYKSEDGGDFIQATEDQFQELILTGGAADKLSYEHIQKADSCTYTVTIEEGQVTSGSIRASFNGTNIELTLPDDA